MKIQTLTLVLILIVAAVSSYNFVSIRALNSQLTGAVVGTSGSKEGAVDFYVMSYCPYGNIAEEGLAPVYDVLKNSVKFNPHYVVYANYQGGGSDYCMADGKYCSMHGIQELNQDVRELCVAKYMGMDEYFAFVLAMNSQCNYKNADSCWENVAKGLKLDTARISKCQNEEAVALLKNEYELNQQLGVSGSPTVFINGESYGGGRSPANYQQAICAKLSPQPSGCSAQLSGASTTATGSC